VRTDRVFAVALLVPSRRSQSLADAAAEPKYTRVFAFDDGRRFFLGFLSAAMCGKGRPDSIAQLLPLRSG
jgi:hypothetical protein